MRSTTLAFLADPVVPAPTPQPGGGAGAQEVLNDLAQLKASGSGGSDPANVPLWIVRSEMANRRLSSTEGPLVTDKPQTKAYAEAHWLDMSTTDKQAFALAAEAADMWEPKQGAAALAQAWTQAVSIAAGYNANHDQKQWLSPHEAIQKLAPAVAASKGAKFNGFTQTTHVQQFRESDLYSQAKSILQNELGRDPTPSELRAFTVAVNAAAKQNPTVTTSQQGNPDGSGQNQVVTYGGAFDPTQTIDEMVKKTDEYAQYQAAVDYFPAVMQALGAVV